MLIIHLVEKVQGLGKVLHFNVSDRLKLASLTLQNVFISISLKILIYEKKNYEIDSWQNWKCWQVCCQNVKITFSNCLL